VKSLPCFVSPTTARQRRNQESEYLAQRRKGAKVKRIRTWRLGDLARVIPRLEGRWPGEKFAQAAKTLQQYRVNCVVSALFAVKMVLHPTGGIP